MAMSTGKVVALIKAMGGGADPAVIEAKVEEWLDAHPEATTTVQDGSITEQKLATSIAQKLGLISSLSDDIVDLERFVKKTINYEFSRTQNVTTGQFNQSTKLLNARIPEGQEYTIRISTTANHGNILLYENHADGSWKVLSYNAAVDTDLKYIAEKDTTSFNASVSDGGFASDGVFTANVTYTFNTSNSLEERVDNIETNVESIDENIVKKTMMEYLNLDNIPASINRIDPDEYIHGKSINYAYGQITDTANLALYYLNVTPGDTVYFWRYHNNAVIDGYSNGIAVFDANGAFITKGGIGGNQYSYTVPSNVYKLGLNFSETALVAGDEFMAIFNDSTNPGEYIPFRNANNAYLSTPQFLKNVDFNALIPTAFSFPTNKYVESYSHGGLSYYYPLDSADAIIGAKKAGMVATEVDVQITLDGVYVCYHDEDMRRVGGTQEQTIANMTYEQLQAFDYGAWFSPKFTGTELLTLDKAAQLCHELGIILELDCKHVKTTAEIQGAKAILDKWGITDDAIWVVGTFVNIWTVLPNAKVVFAAGNALTGSNWSDPNTGWFAGFNSNFPEDKKSFVDGMPVVPEGVWFGVAQTYALMDGEYGIEGLIRESELARERNIKYGLYAVDDVETIATLSANLPYLTSVSSNKISYQNAMNQHYGITKADYIIDS